MRKYLKRILIGGIAVTLVVSGLSIGCSKEEEEPVAQFNPIVIETAEREEIEQEEVLVQDEPEKSEIPVREGDIKEETVQQEEIKQEEIKQEEIKQEETVQQEEIKQEEVGQEEIPVQENPVVEDGGKEELFVEDELEKEEILIEGVESENVVVHGSGFGIEAETMLATVTGAPETVKVVKGESARETMLNKDWKFYLGDNSSASNESFDDSSWKTVDVPHDFSISQSFTSSDEAESGFLPGGTGWYRKAFVLPEGDQGKTFMLDFDGVYSDAYVYVNGTYVGENHYGYNNFAFDITDQLIVDGQTENVIAVKAVNDVPTSRWYSGSGIYRDVKLYALDKVHVDLDGTYVTTPNISIGNGTVNIKADVVNDGDALADITVVNKVYQKDDTSTLKTTYTSVKIDAGEKETTSTNVQISNPKLWSIESPNLYVVETELSVDGEVVDTYKTTFGFRYFEFNSSGFNLNGKAVKLNGVCMHHDQGALGSAAYYDAMYRQLSIMKEMGCNAIRTSHNPVDEDFIEICNELGLLVIEELYDGLVDPKNGNGNDFSKYFEESIDEDNGIYGGSGLQWAEFVAQTVVKRDRNDPCIIAWSLGNEIQEGTYWNNADRYDDIIANLIGKIKMVDTTRVVTSGDNNRGGDQRLVDVLNTITNAGGVVGFNYADSASALNNLASRFGGSTGAIIASETASATNSRGIYMGQASNSSVDGKYHLTSYDTSSVGWGLTAHDSIYNTYQSDCVAGEFVWTGFDYIGEPTPWNGTDGGDSGRGAIPNSSYFGIVETTGFEKDTYYLYRSQWNKDETTLHLVTAWDQDNMMQDASGKTPVWVYSNAPYIELFRNNVLIGTATRSSQTSAAGHTYYTYTTTSNDTNICTTSSGSEADGLYAVFNVAYEEGTIRAKAYKDTNKSEEIVLDEKDGQYIVTTPGTVTKLEAKTNVTNVTSDGESLVYVEIDVLDANGNLDTTATNTINVSVSGNGVIAGVDNGDQATTHKYQQTSVLTSATTAKINAYAGKALVIIRTTESTSNGNVQVNLTSDGLSGKTVSVNTIAMESENSGDVELVSYTMVRDYSEMTGTAPVLETSATGKLSNDTIVEGTIAWNAITADQYNNAGDYTIQGTLTFDGYDPIPVTARLHMIANVIAMRNISTVTMQDVVPTLPTTVRGVLANGTLAGEFNVEWDAMSPNQFSQIGKIVIINGTATVLGNETLPVTAAVRVAEVVNTESTNVAPFADSLTQDIASDSQSDSLESIRDRNTNPGEATNGRWTNYNNRGNSSDSTLTFTWATAQALSGVNLYYRYDNTSAKPESVTFLYSLNGTEFVEISAIESDMEDVTISNGAAFSYQFEVINPVAIKIKLTQRSGHCVGLYEAEIMTFAGSISYNNSADLSGISSNGNPVADFAADKLDYTSISSIITASTDVNAGITVLPPHEGVVRILTISEDGSAAKIYAITVNNDCTHTDTTFQNQVDETCTTDGYTGDEVCNNCGEIVTEGQVIPATGHSYSAVAGPNGTTVYTCSSCGDSYTTSTAIAPSVTLLITPEQGNASFNLKGTFNDYTNLNTYFPVKGHGIVYIKAARLGTRNLTLDTPGRTNLIFKSYDSDGNFGYGMTPSSEDTAYVVKSYLTYEDAIGVTRYVYSDPTYIKYSSSISVGNE